MAQSRKSPGPAGRLNAACWLLGAVLLGASPQAAAQERGNVQAEQSRELRTRQPPQTARDAAAYATVDGMRFVIDRSGPLPLIHFENSRRTQVLFPQIAPRGDVLYLSNTGVPVVRVSVRGNVTLYTRDNRQGVPAYFVESAPALEEPSITPRELFNFILDQSHRLSGAVGHLVMVDVDISSVGAEHRVVALLTMAADTVARAAANPATAEKTRHLSRIRVIEAERSQPSFEDGVLTLRISRRSVVQMRSASTEIAVLFTD